jgi:hypothetical protein
MNYVYLGVVVGIGHATSTPIASIQKGPFTRRVRVVAEVVL